MAMPLAESLRDVLLDRALGLPENERVTLARELLESVEPFDLSDEQRAELRAAMDAIDQGRYVDGDAFLRELNAGA